MEKIIIIRRFFDTIQFLINSGVLRGFNTFCVRYNINRRNITQCKLDPDGHGGIFTPVWMSYLVRDYMVSPLWLLIGEGAIFRDGWTAENVRKCAKSVQSKTGSSKSL